MFLNYSYGNISLNNYSLSDELTEINNIKLAIVRHNVDELSCRVERYLVSNHPFELDVLIDHSIDLDSDSILCYDLQCNEFIYINGCLLSWERVYSVD